MIVRWYGTRPAAFLLSTILGLGCCAAACAQDATQQVRAARMTVAHGSVTVNEPNNAASIPGQVNLPLLSGVQVATGDDGQAEIEFEDGSVVRLTPNSALSLDNLAVGSDGIFVTDMSLLRGLAYCELRATPQYSFVLNAGGDMLSPIENTSVRVTFDQPPAGFAVLDGTAQIERQGGYQAQVRGGETLQPDAADNGRYFLSQGIAADSWDQWNEDLDQAAAAGSSSTTAVRDSYAGADGYGWSDLDANGSWYNVPGQGEVWQPDIASTDTGFDPYGNGAWVWSGGTGYVWASGYTWGWTPYHCGNWSYYNGFGWGWAPGAACGGAGWGFFHGGNPVNISRFPSGYHPIRVPTPRPGPLRPILPVQPYSVAVGQHAEPQHGLRTIDGLAVSRIAPVRGPVNAGGPAAGSSLRRDFPINPANHTHELGVASGSISAVNSRPAQGPAGSMNGSQTVPAGTGQPVYGNQPAYGGRVQSYPANGMNHPMPTGRPVQNIPPAQRAADPGLQRTLPSTLPQYQPGQSNDPSASQQRRNQPRPTSENPVYAPPQQQTQPRPALEPHPTYAQPQQQTPQRPALEPHPTYAQPQQQTPQRPALEPHPTYAQPPQQQTPQRPAPEPHPTYTPPQQQTQPRPSPSPEPRPTSAPPPQRTENAPAPRTESAAPSQSSSSQQQRSAPK